MKITLTYGEMKKGLTAMLRQHPLMLIPKRFEVKEIQIVYEDPVLYEIELGPDSAPEKEAKADGS
jgi:hypothetical protein